MIYAPHGALVSFNGRSPGSGFPCRLPGFPVACGKAHIPYSRGGGSGISPASRFTFPVEKHRWLLDRTAPEPSQLRWRKSGKRSRQSEIRAKKSRAGPGFEMWSEPFPAKPPEGNTHGAPMGGGDAHQRYWVYVFRSLYFQQDSLHCSVALSAWLCRQCISSSVQVSCL